MSNLVRSVTADSSGNATIIIADVPTGLEWVIAQVGIETNPVGTGVTCVQRLNNRFITSSPFGSADSAQGPPYLTLRPGDTLTLTWTGAPPRANCITSMLYTEHAAGTVGGVGIV